MDEAPLFEFMLDVVFGLVLLGGLALVVRSLFARRACATCQRLTVSFVLGPISAQEVNVMSLRLTNEQQVKVAVAARTVHGHEAALDGAVTWTSSNPEVATVTPSSTRPLEALVVAVGLGAAQITVSADADLTGGVRPISGVIDVEVVAAEANTLGLVAGTPEEQPVSDAAAPEQEPTTGIAGRIEPATASAAVVD